VSLTLLTWGWSQDDVEGQLKTLTDLSANATAENWKQTAVTTAQKCQAHKGIMQPIHTAGGRLGRHLRTNHSQHCCDLGWCWGDTFTSHALQYKWHR